MTHPLERAAARVERLRTRHAEVVQLAALCSLAVRIEPHLLRCARLELLPDADVGVEADLWFGPLVESRGPRAIVLDHHVACVLRRELAADPDRLAQAVAVTQRAHAGAPATLRLEEELNAIALLDEERAAEAIDAALRPALATIAAGGDRAQRLAQWAYRALAHAEPAVREAPAAVSLALGAALALGEKPSVAHMPSAASGFDTMGWLLPKLANIDTTNVGVELTEGELTFHEAREGGNTLPLPATTPLAIAASWEDAEGVEHSALVEPVPGRWVKLPEHVTQVTLRTLDGASYLLTTRAAPKRPPPEPAKPPTPDDPVYICYTRTDGKIAQRLAGDLRESGVNVWLDAADISPGSNWEDEIQRSLRAAGSMLVLLSPAAVESNQVQDEYSFALGNGKPIIPVLLADCDVPMSLAGLQRVDFRRDYQEGLLQLRRGLASIGRVAGSKRGARASEARSEGAPRIYISHRRTSEMYARRIREALTASLAQATVVTPLDFSLEAGDVVKELQSQVAQAKVLLVLIDGDWAEELSTGGTWAERELEVAFANGLRVLPILLDDAPFPPESSLPPSIRELVRLNAAVVKSDTWNADLRRIMDVIQHQFE